MKKLDTRKTLVLTAQPAAGPSRAQAQFNASIRRIRDLRARRVAWEEVQPRYQEKYFGEFLPLLDQLRGLKCQFLHWLDAASCAKGLTRSERRSVSACIVELAPGLLAEQDDEALKALYNRHSASDYDREEAEGKQAAKEALEEMLGVELGDEVDLDDPQEFPRRAAEQLEERERARRARRRPSPKQSAREEQQKAEQRQLTQSLRELYLKLVSALHPDREPDPEQRSLKTALMQRVNDAYEKRNLLELLELQLELEGLHQGTLQNLGGERLERYNRILKEQQRQLEEELRRVEMEFCQRFGQAPSARITPETVLRLLNQEIVEVRHTIADAERDQRDLRRDPGALKAWLRDLRRAPAEEARTGR